jgi:hypothetical protein
MTAWEYLIVALPPFKTATAVQGQSDSVTMLNREGEDGWEAVGMTALDDGHVAVLMKRRADTERTSRPQ